jgi:hypothetical protein
MRVKQWADKKIKQYKERGGRMFMQLPDAWFEKWTVACENGHVSNCVIKSELHGSLCMYCGQVCTALIPPNTSERFLKSIVAGRKISRLTNVEPDKSVGSKSKCDGLAG